MEQNLIPVPFIVIRHSYNTHTPAKKEVRIEELYIVFPNLCCRKIRRISVVITVYSRVPKSDKLSNEPGKSNNPRKGQHS